MRQSRIDPRDQRFARRRIARQRGEFADLRETRCNVSGYAEGHDAEAQILKRRARRGSDEAARDHHVRIERQHFLHRSAGGGEARRRRRFHRTGAFLLAVMRDRQQLTGGGHFSQDGIGAGIEADNGRSLGTGWRTGPAPRTRGEQQDRCSNQRFHIVALIPPNTLRPAVP